MRRCWARSARSLPRPCPSWRPLRLFMRTASTASACTSTPSPCPRLPSATAPATMGTWMTAAAMPPPHHPHRSQGPRTQPVRLSGVMHVLHACSPPVSNQPSVRRTCVMHARIVIVRSDKGSDRMHGRFTRDECTTRLHSCPQHAMQATDATLRDPSCAHMHGPTRHALAQVVSARICAAACTLEETGCVSAARSRALLQGHPWRAQRKSLALPPHSRTYSIRPETPSSWNMPSARARTTRTSPICWRMRS